MEFKKCNTCGKSKPLTEFFAVSRSNGVRATRGGMGVRSICKHCVAEKKNPGIHACRAEQAQRHAGGQKLCRTCNTWKVIDEFHKRAASKDGIGYTCKQCANGRVAKWHEENPDAFSDWYRVNKVARSDYWRQWYESNKEAAKAAHKRWAKENSHIVNALIARRVAAKRNATPAWANTEAINAIYAEAARLTAATGIRHEVDHFYPILGKLVCGLHCEANLQILTKSENSSKNNRMPEEYYETIRNRRSSSGYDTSGSRVCRSGNEAA